MQPIALTGSPDALMLAAFTLAVLVITGGTAVVWVGHKTGFL